MKSLGDIRKKRLKQITGELGVLGQQLVKLGWSREKVLAYMKQLLDDPTDTVPRDPNSSRKED